MKSINTNVVTSKDVEVNSSSCMYHNVSCMYHA